MTYRRKMTWAEGVKRATVEPKSAEIVEEVRKQLQDEGVPETTIAGILQHVVTLPEEDEELLQ